MTNDRRKTSLGWAAQPEDQADEPWQPPAAAYAPSPYARPEAPPAYPPPPPAYASPPPAYAPPPPAYPPPPHAYAPPPPAYAPPPPPPPPAYPHAPPESPYPVGQRPSEPRDATPPPVPREPPSLSIARVRFIRLTYLHLLFAIAAFAGLLRLLMTQPVLVAKVATPLVRFALGGRWNWGVVLAAFMAVSWLADRWAHSASSRAVQYAGLAFYTLAEALIFVPLLAIVEWKTQAILARGGADPHIVRDAAFVTLGIFSALTLSVFLSNRDFSFLRSALVMASGAALTLIAMSLVFGFHLGLVFSVAMVLLAAGYVLYQTSQVLAHYDPRQHVAAALALFSSVALMFWYVIRIFLRARD